MTDWTTCRVVRDRDGDLWFRGCDSDDLWTANTNYPDVFLTTDEVLTVFGPLMPVLDADGLPVVHTVGDLTARHLRRDISVEGMRTTATLLAMRMPPRNQPLPLVAFLVRIDGTIGTTDYYPLDAPCEVLSLAEGADRPCPRCHGAGWYYYDEHHSKPCEVCCLHAVGVWQLLNHYGGRNGSWACRAGCGATWSTEDAYEAARTTPRSDADASRALGDGEVQDRPGESIVVTAH